ncbi:MAG: magnesium chelatase domain-containing protein, partial [Steroidobacteraceae bacterium]
MTTAEVATTLCRGQLGLQAPLVHVEVNLGSGLPAFAIVGLPAAVVRESRERVRAALTNSGFAFPAGRITVNLAPADLPKEGGRFDLPIALGILLASSQLRCGGGAAARGVRPREFYGELSLSGELKPVRGLLLAATHAARARHQILVPRSNAGEAALVSRACDVIAAGHLLEACAVLRGERGSSGAAGIGAAAAGESSARSTGPGTDSSGTDLAEIRGQHHAKRALVIAAAGSHSLILFGPPGSGKSMLAGALPALLPPLTRVEALQAAAIASVSAAGLDPRAFGRRPFRAPHHTASATAIVGGGPQARPGEVSLA